MTGPKVSFTQTPSVVVFILNPVCGKGQGDYEKIGVQINILIKGEIMQLLNHLCLVISCSAV